MGSINFSFADIRARVVITSIIAIAIIGVAVAFAFAETGIPGSSPLTATYNTMTGQLSVSGSYANAPTGSQEQVGYAVFINGATPVTPGTGSLDGNNTNAMHLLPTPATASGTWSDNTHTLASAPTSVCAVVYDVHTNNVGTNSGHNDIVAGSHRNQDNSYEQNGDSYKYKVYDGKLDVNKDGNAGAGDDDGTLGGKTIINGEVDWNGSGTVTNSDDSPANAFFGKTVIDGKIDMTGNGSISNFDDGELTDDPATCVAPTLYTPPTGTITVTKVVLPASDSGLFNLQIDGSTAGTGANVGDGGTTGAITKLTGAHTISETAGTDTSLSNYTSVISGDCASNGSISLSTDQHANCTITNTRKGTITITKVSTGGTGTFDFSASGTDQSVGAFQIDTSPQGGPDKTFSNIQAGTYTVAEGTLPSGWDFTSLECSETGTSNSTVNTDTKTASITLDPGETVHCTYTNTKRGKITVHKDVVNPDGGAVSDNHSFTVHLSDNQGDPQAGQTLSENTDVVYNNLVPGHSYSVTEDQNTDYGNISYSTDCNIGSLSAGQEAVCTITNKQLQGSLVVKKVVTNPNGGNATAGLFSFLLNQGSPIQFIENGTNPLLGENDLSVNPGSYSITENPFEGAYAISYNNCEFVVHSNGQMNESTTCTITNSDIPSGDGAITVIKYLPNNNGGTATISDFPLWVTDSADPQNPVQMTSGVSHFFTAGHTYTVSESNPGELTGYNESISCVPTGGGTAQTGETSVTFDPLADQASWICTITNDDAAPQLTLFKHVNNGEGTGTSTPNQWTLTASTTPGDVLALSGQDQGNGVSSGSTFQAGNYLLSEFGGPEGYTAGSWVCTGAQNDGSFIHLGIGAVVSCTITNTAEPAHLTIVKHTDAASGDNIFHFTVTSTGDTTHYSSSLDLDTAQSEVHSATSSVIDIPAGTFDVSEVNLPEGGWNLAGISCVYEDQSVGNSDIVAGTEHITVGNGDNVTCTFTNTTQGTLIVKKVVVNDNGGTATASTFSFKIGDGSPVAFNSNGENDVVLEPGTYTVTETAADGYTTSYDNCTNVQVPAGGEATCTITNDDVAPVITPEPPTGGGGGNGPIVGSGGFGFLGSVLGASTSSVGGGGGEVLGASTSTCSTPLLTQYMRMGKVNDPAQVKLLQNFLNGNLGLTIPLSGFFGPLTDSAVKAFQVKYAAEVLTPWGLTAPTGFVYLTTERWINLLYCQSLNIPVPPLVPYTGQ